MNKIGKEDYFQAEYIDTDWFVAKLEGNRFWHKTWFWLYSKKLGSIEGLEKSRKYLLVYRKDTSLFCDPVVCYNICPEAILPEHIVFLHESGSKELCYMCEYEVTWFVVKAV